MLTAFLLQTSVSIFPLGLEFVGFHRRHFHATSTWHIWQILEFFLKNKKAGWNHSKAAIIFNFYYRFQTSKTHFVTRERAHSRDRLQKESWFAQISPFHACYFCARDRQLSRDISRFFILKYKNTKIIKEWVKLFETTQGILLSHPVKVVKSVHADRDLSKKCHR